MIGSAPRHAYPARWLEPVIHAWGLDLSCTVYDQQRLWVLGRLYGYPACCIEAFVVDVAAGRLPGMLRGLTPGGWVPCPGCFGVVRWL